MLQQSLLVIETKQLSTIFVYKLHTRCVTENIGTTASWLVAQDVLILPAVVGRQTEHQFLTLCHRTEGDGLVGIHLGCIVAGADVPPRTVPDTWVTEY